MRAKDITPAVSVLIAVHNGQPYVESAVRSIMEQSLRDIEIIIVDDASRDDTPDVLAKLAAQDPRIRIATLTQNKRLPGALNHGLTLVRAPLVARMDADDIALPDRLAIQKAFMDAHPEVILSAASMEQIDAVGKPLRISYRPRDAFACQWLARFHMPLVHPTFMFRTSAELTYDAQWTVSEDYDFTARALALGDVVSLPDIVLQYRVHEGSITGSKWTTQLLEARQIAERVQAQQLPADVCAALSAVNAAFLGREPSDTRAIFAGLRTLIAHDRRRQKGDTAWMRRQSAQMALRALQRSGRGRKGQLTRAFLFGGGLDFILPLLMRFGEIKGLIRPKAL